MSTNFPNGLRSRGVPLPSGLMPPTGGTVIHVDSGHTNASNSNAGTNPNHPMTSIDAAVAKCAANNGDQIWVYPGHAETVSGLGGLDLDIAGITVVFLGNRNDRGTITFGTLATADMDVDAADITMISPRFVAGIDALSGPIDVNSARFRMYDATWNDGTTINTIDCVIADANADNMVIDGFEFIDGDAAGTQKQSFIQVAGATGVIIRNIKCTGDFGTGIIENGTAWIDALLENLVLDNASATPTVCILLQATSTGWVRNSSLRVASGSTGYTADNDMQFHDVGVTGTDAYTVSDPTIGNLNDAAATGAVTTTDTLVAYIKQLVTQMGVEADTDPVSAILSGAGGITTWKTAAIPATGISISEVVRQLYAAIEGTAAGHNGVLTWPAEGVPNDNVSLSEVLRSIYNQTSHSGSASVVTRQAGWGNIVTKTGNMQAATADLFTVTGKVLITLLTGEVVTANLDGNVTTLQLRVKTTNEVLCGATTVTSDVLGTMYLVAGAATALLNGRDAPTTRVASLSGVDDGGTNDYTQAHSPIILGLAGGSATIEHVLGAADQGTGDVTWTLMYIPLEASASVAAAA